MSIGLNASSGSIASATPPIGTGSGRITPGLTCDRSFGCSIDAEQGEDREQIRACGGRARVCSARN